MHIAASCLMLLLGVGSAWAQALEPMAINVAGGLAVRGTGDVDPCCGREASLDLPRAFWIAGSFTGRIAERIGFDAEVSWHGEKEYNAYSSAVPAYGGALAQNRTTGVIGAGLLRARAWNSDDAALDFLAGAGVLRESTRSSILPNPLIRATLLPRPTSVPIVITSTRQLVPFILGIDAFTSDNRLGFFASARIHLLTGPVHENRSDLELGRMVFRIGIGIRVSLS